MARAPMPRFAAILPLLAAAACSQQQQPEAASEVWAAGRDGLCLTGSGEALRAGLITYGEGDSNCSIAGSASRDGERIRITPAGDSQCAVEVIVIGDSAKVGQRTSACEYYCGPGADFSGRELQRSEKPVNAIRDFAGDPLC